MVKHDTVSCKHYWIFCRLAECSRFVWLQTDWIDSCEQVFLGDGGLDRIMLVCDSESSDVLTKFT